MKCIIQVNEFVPVHSTRLETHTKKSYKSPSFVADEIKSKFVWYVCKQFKILFFRWKSYYHIIFYSKSNWPHILLANFRHAYFSTFITKDDLHFLKPLIIKPERFLQKDCNWRREFSWYINIKMKSNNNSY